MTEDALAEMQRLVSSGPLSRIRPEARPKATAARKPTALDESEEDQGATGSLGASLPHPSAHTFAEAMVKFFDSYRQCQAASADRTSALDKALDGPGSHEGGLISTCRNAAAGYPCLPTCQPSSRT